MPYIKFSKSYIKSCWSKEKHLHVSTQNRALNKVKRYQALGQPVQRIFIPQQMEQ